MVPDSLADPSDNATFDAGIAMSHKLITTLRSLSMTQQPLGSQYVDVAQLEWQATRFPGISMKMLWQDESGDAYTALFRVEPGATLPRHRHTGVEQTFVIEGSLVDDEGTCTSGNFV